MNFYRKFLLKYFRSKGALLMFCIFLLPVSTFSQTLLWDLLRPSPQYNSKIEIYDARYSKKNDKRVEDTKFRKWQFDCMFTVVKNKQLMDLGGFVVADHVLDSTRCLGGATIKADYYLNKRWGFGIDYTFWNRQYIGRNMLGFVGDQDFMYSILKSEGEVYDQVRIDYVNNGIGIHGNYKLLNHSRARRQPFEINLRAGLSYNSLVENQFLTVAKCYNEMGTFWTIPVYDDVVVANKHKTIHTSNINGSIGMQLLVHMNESFSIILFDVSDNFCLVSSYVSETSVTVDDSKTIRFNKHPVSAAGIAYSFGFALHF